MKRAMMGLLSQTAMIIIVTTVIAYQVQLMYVGYAFFTMSLALVLANPNMSTDIAICYSIAGGVLYILAIEYNSEWFKLFGTVFCTIAGMFTLNELTRPLVYILVALLMWYVSDDGLVNMLISPFAFIGLGLFIASPVVIMIKIIKVLRTVYT